MTIDEELTMAAGRLKRVIDSMTSPDADGPWHTGIGVNHEALSVTVLSKGGDAYAVADTVSVQVASYIAAMHPEVGMVVARMLSRAADHWSDQYPCCDNGPDMCHQIVEPALEIARLINR